MNRIENLIVINDFNYINGGAAKVALTTAKAFEDDDNIKIYFFSAVNRKATNGEKINYITTNQEEALYDSNKIRGAINGIWNFKAKRQFDELLKQFNPDNTIIHIHGWMKALSSSIFYIAHKRKFKVVVTLHDYFSICPNGGFYNYTKQEICKIKPMSAKCITCNCDSRNYIIKLYRILRQFVQNNIVQMNKKIRYIVSISDFSIELLKNNLSPKVKIKKIYNPIETDCKDKIKDISNNDTYIYVGRLSKEKGIELFCKAISKLDKKGIIIGDGTQIEELKNKYVGWKNKKEVTKYMKKARALIFPSLWYECAPLTTLEALSMGLPCIVSDECAAKEFILDTKNGLLFNRNNVDSLIETILLLENNEYLEQMSEQAYQTYWKKPLDIEIYKNSLQKFYNEILNDKEI